MELLVHKPVMVPAVTPKSNKCENPAVRKPVRRLAIVGILAGIGWAAWRTYEKSRTQTGLDWEAQPFPYPPKAVSAPPKAVAKPAATATAPAWVEPDGETCPRGYPVKAKVKSGIFHVPGGRNYDRTVPDRCYADAGAATADGLRAAKA